MRDLDRFLRGKVFGPLAWWVERHFGYSKFAIARGCTVASFVMMVTYFVLTASDPLWWRSFITLIACLPWSMLCLLRLTTIKRDEELERTRPDGFAVVVEATWLLRIIQWFAFTFFDALVLGMDIGLDRFTALQWLIIVPLRTHLTVFCVGTYITTVSPPPKREEKPSPFAKPVMT